MKAVFNFFSILIILVFISSNINLSAQDAQTVEEFDLESSTDIKRAFKLLRDAYRSERDENAQVYQRQEDVLDPFSGLCIECERLTEFTGQVNEILTQLSETNEHSQTQISELMAHSAYTEIVDQNGIQERCFSQIQSGMTQEYRDTNLDDAIIIYRGEVELNRVSSFSLFGQSPYNRSVFLRGKRPDADKLIRVDLSPHEKPVVTLYQLQEDTSEFYTFQLDKINASLPNFEFDGTQAQENNSQQEDPPERVDPLQAQMRSFEMEYSSSGLPNKVTILDFRDRSKISENFEIESDIEISSEEQEMIFGLARSRDASMAQMRIEKEGDVELAFDMNFPTGIVQTQLLLGDEGAGAELNLGHSENSRTKISHTRRNQSTSIEHSTDFGNRSNLSVRFNRSSGQESGHIVYRTLF